MVGEEPKYRIDSTEVIISKSHNIFDHIEIVVSRNLGKKIKIDPDQRAWYVSAVIMILSGDQALMWQRSIPHFLMKHFRSVQKGTTTQKICLNCVNVVNMLKLKF